MEARRATMAIYTINNNTRGRRLGETVEWLTVLSAESEQSGALRQHQSGAGGSSLIPPLVCQNERGLFSRTADSNFFRLGSVATVTPNTGFPPTCLKANRASRI